MNFIPQTLRAVHGATLAPKK